MQSHQARSATILLGLFVLICSGCCDPIHFKDCGSVTGALKQVNVDGCTKIPCTLLRGTNATIKVDFTMKNNVKNATSDVNAILLGLPVVFNPPERNACKGQGLSCPLNAGHSYTFIGTVPVRKFYPNAQLVVQWALRDEQSKNIFCMMIPIRVSS